MPQSPKTLSDIYMHRPYLRARALNVLDALIRRRLKNNDDIPLDTPLDCLHGLTRGEILALPYVGPKTTEEIWEALSAAGVVGENIDAIESMVQWM